MGGGRRVANLPRVAGHRAGVAAVKRIVEHAPHVGIGCLTVYAFSSDNWRRPPTEVQSIFWLLRAFLRLERAKTSAGRSDGWRLSAGAIVYQNCCCARSTRQSLRPLGRRNCCSALPSITLRATRS